MGTQVGVCYHTLSSAVRFVIVPTNDSELDDPALNISGHTFAKMTKSNYNNKTTVNTLSDFVNIVTSSVITP